MIRVLKILRKVTHMEVRAEIHQIRIKGEPDFAMLTFCFKSESTKCGFYFWD